MQTMIARHWHPVVNTDCLISLLSREFLWKESLDPKERMKAWFNQVDKSRVTSWEDWLDLASDVIAKAAEKDLSRTLERALCPYERTLLKRSVVDFVEIYDGARSNVVNV